jgi:hypothetical protein
MRCSFAFIKVYVVINETGVTFKHFDFYFRAKLYRGFHESSDAIPNCNLMKGEAEAREGMELFVVKVVGNKVVSS